VIAEDMAPPEAAAQQHRQQAVQQHIIANTKK
jgi:hypothetical protein